MRKWVSSALIFLCALAPFIFHGASAETGKVTITFWHAMDGPRGKALQDLVDEFNRTHPGIEVEAEFKGSRAEYANNYGDLIRNLLASLRTANPPTMSQVYENWTAQFAGVNALVPIEKFTGGKEGYSASELADFVPTFMKSNRVPDGRLWSLPFNKSLFVLYYNADLLQKAGIQPPKTWDDFRNDAKALTVAAGGQVSRYGFTDPPNVDLFGLVFYAFGGNYFKDGKADFNGAEGKSALAFISGMSRDRIYLPDYGALNDFASGKAAMYIDTTAALPYLAKLASFHVGVAAIPSQVRPVSLFAGTNLAIFRRATPAQQKAAWTFIKWLLDPRRTAAWAMETGYLPVRLSAMKLPAYRDYLRRDPRMEIPLSQLDEAFTDPRVWAWESIRGFVDEGVEEAITGKIGVDKALDQAAQRTNLLLAQ